MSQLTLDPVSGKTVELLPRGERELFYCNSTAESRCIGHLRFDVDACGKLWSSWWPHQAAQKHNRQPFKNELDAIVNALQRRVFSKPKRIPGTLLDLGIPVIEEGSQYHGFHIDTDAYCYYFRIFPQDDNFNNSYHMRRRAYGEGMGV